MCVCVEGAGRDSFSSCRAHLSRLLLLWWWWWHGPVVVREPSAWRFLKMARSSYGRCYKHLWVRMPGVAGRIHVPGGAWGDKRSVVTNMITDRHFFWEQLLPITDPESCRQKNYFHCRDRSVGILAENPSCQIQILFCIAVKFPLQIQTSGSKQINFVMASACRILLCDSEPAQQKSCHSAPKAPAKILLGWLVM